MQLLSNVILWLMIPVSLWALVRIVKQTRQAVRAKRALEDEVLRIVTHDMAARIIIAQAAQSDSEPVQDARRVVYQGVEALSEDDAKPVRYALSQGEHQGGASYVRTIARHVNARLPETMAAA
jgi:hypothetical protein